jgi:hypothetical protein
MVAAVGRLHPDMHGRHNASLGERLKVVFEAQKLEGAVISGH